MRAGVLFLAGLLTGCSLPVGSPGPLASVVDRDGLPTDGLWGAWSAEPGARGVVSKTLLRVDSTERVVIRFTDTAFRGVDDPRWIVPIEGNVEFGAARGAVPPEPEAFTWMTSNNTSSELEISHPGTFIAYRVRQIGSPLPAQTYLAGYQVIPHRS